MANTAVQILAYVLCYTGLCGLIASTCMTEWKIVARANGDTAVQEERVGLWMRCSKGAGAEITCTPFTSILHQPREINISRALMISSIVLCGLALLLTIPGLKCTRCLDGSKQMKSKVAIVGGALSILGGACAFGLICWYANEVAQKFASHNTGLIKYEFGRAMFVGGAAALLSIIGGALLCASSKPQKQFRSHPEKPSVSQNQASEYV
ncbi:hypothetical protein NFI96_014510 [Prochilodus magdalenae]|nr:hypothetical protein NFI96_014510 [Prochilodus magdalenae]